MTDKKTLKKINQLLTDVDRNGYKCTGKPEPLRGNLAGYWSVRIDKKNRIVFRIEGDILESAAGRTIASKRRKRGTCRVIRAKLCGLARSWRYGPPKGGHFCVLQRIDAGGAAGTCSRINLP